MKKSLWLTGFICLSLVFGACAVIIGNADTLLSENTLPVSTEIKKAPLIVIDPGHGGEDGGCVGVDGVLEKELNLLQSQSLCETLCAMGVPAEMTRTDDTMLYGMYGDMKDYGGMKKVFDLRNRLRFAEESGASALISIHMNKFTDEKYSGAQVYYSTNSDGSTQLAALIQESITGNLQKENNRLTKKAGSNIYILNRAHLTAVLCECGFLSNPQEAELLRNEDYRKKLSLCIAAAALEWIRTVDNESAAK